VAPRQTADGEAMSMISGFRLNHRGKPFGRLTIDTQFASGEPAVTIARTNPRAAQGIMNVEFVQPGDDALARRRANAIDYINKHAGDARLDRIADRLGVRNLAATSQDAINVALDQDPADKFEDHVAVIYQELGMPF
jgi:hypothetical protein